MTLAIITEPSAAQQQTDLFNRASRMVVTKTYTPPAGTAWTVVGMVLADAVTTDNELALVAAMTTLAEITNVANPRFWVPTPSEILINPGGGEPDTHQLVLSTEARWAGNRGYGGDVVLFDGHQYEELSPPLGKNLFVCNCRLPAKITSAQMIADLEGALVGITGINVAEHLIGDVVPVNALGVSLKITTRMRIDPISVEPPA